MASQKQWGCGCRRAGLLVGAIVLGALVVATSPVHASTRHSSRIQPRWGSEKEHRLQGCHYIDHGEHKVQLVKDVETAWHSHVELHHAGDDSVRGDPERRSQFEKDVRFVNEHNRRFLLKQVTYHVRVNRHSARKFTDPGFVTGLTPPYPNSLGFANGRIFGRRYASVTPGAWSDLRTYLQPIQNQGQCGACWAYASVAALEGALSYANGSNSKLSEQQLIDCAFTSSSGGCGGGWPSDALQYLTSTGVTTSSYYPTTGGNTTCQGIAAGAPAVTIVGYEEVPAYDELSIAQVVTKQPVVSFIYASSSGFLLYAGGVYSETDCLLSPDHAVTIVGFFNASAPSTATALAPSNQSYWLVRNSWGAGWGEAGYMRLAMIGGAGTCGITYIPALFPIISLPNDPCALNPCGVGRCAVSPNGAGYLCTCPPGYLALGSTYQYCGPLDVCGSSSTLLCGDGNCTNDNLGGYTCSCPVGQQQGKNAYDGGDTCVASPIQIVVVGEDDNVGEVRYTCNDFASKYGVFPEMIQAWNSFLPLNFGCDTNYGDALDDSPVPVGTILKIPVNNPACVQQYAIPATVQYARDAYGNVLASSANATNCSAVAAQAGITLAQLNALNLNQIDPQHCADFGTLVDPTGLEICTKQNTNSLQSTSTCTKVTYVKYVNGKLQTCAQLAQACGLPSTLILLQYNPGLKCTALKYNQAVCCTKAGGVGVVNNQPPSTSFAASSPPASSATSSSDYLPAPTSAPTSSSRRRRILSKGQGGGRKLPSPSPPPPLPPKPSPPRPSPPRPSPPPPSPPGPSPPPSSYPRPSPPLPSPPRPSPPRPSPPPSSPSRSTPPPSPSPLSGTTSGSASCGNFMLYFVGLGDSCWSIWKHSNMNVSAFLAANPGLFCDRLNIGAQVCVTMDLMPVRKRHKPPRRPRPPRGGGANGGGGGGNGKPSPSPPPSPAPSPGAKDNNSVASNSPPPARRTPPASRRSPPPSPARLTRSPPRPMPRPSPRRRLLSPPPLPKRPFRPPTRPIKRPPRPVRPASPPPKSQPRINNGGEGES